MKYNEITIRYGELSTKGKNRKTFIRKLSNNVKKVLKPFDQVEVKTNWDRMHVFLHGEDPNLVMDKVKRVFGVETYYPAVTLPKDVSIEKIEEVVKALVSQAASNQTPHSFKINAKRKNKQFPLDTYAVNTKLGDYVLEMFPNLKVDVKHPDLSILVELRNDGVFISSKLIKGALGLPIGTGGKAMMLLSGGIDSPVASYLGMKKGLKLDMIHFYSPPYTSPQALDKAKELTSKLANYSGSIKFFQVPFTKIQEEIRAKVPAGYLMTVQRRVMFQIAEKLAQQQEAKGLVTGESLGQVASQTLDSMEAISKGINLPILRPLLSFDKTEIIKIAKGMDTYETSILPFEDCCTIFTPPSPKTKPAVDKTEKFEKFIDADKLIKEALANVKVVQINANDKFLHKNKSEVSQLL